MGVGQLDATMKLGITKDDLPHIARNLCTLISGAGIGIFLAIWLIPKEERKFFILSFFVTSVVVIVAGGILRSLLDCCFSRKAEEKPDNG
jgi:hypothetical protein